MWEKGNFRQAHPGPFYCALGPKGLKIVKGTTRKARRKTTVRRFCREVTMKRAVDGLIAELQHSRDVPSALQALAATLQPYGFQRVGYGYVEQPWGPFAGPRPISLVHHNFPRGWDKLWIRYATHDPIYLASLETALPVDMTEVRKRRRIDGLEGEAWRCLDHLGLSTALVIPTHLPQGRFSNVGIYWDPNRSLAEWRQMLTQHHDALFVIGHYFCDTVDRKFFARRASASDAKLTSREVECLTSIALGKTNAETAAILGIARATVRFHLENAMRKLGARNRAGAVAAAYAGGWLRAH
jgi:DNA-binding CsgD family transcriptional regulator